MRLSIVDSSERAGTPVVVVVDVLRAFTTAAVALAAGADGVVLCGTRAEALAVPDAVRLTDGAPDPAFDGVNSPVLVERIDLAGRPVALSTTCGTVAAVAAGHADTLLCASFVVAGATARHVRALEEDTTFVVTGTTGGDEDRACADYIAARIIGSRVDPTPYLRRVAASPAAADLATGVRLGYAGIHADDVARCTRPDAYPFAMVAAHDDHGLRLRMA